MKLGLGQIAKRQIKQRLVRTSFLGVLVALLIILTPVLKKNFQPRISSAASVPKTWQLNASTQNNYEFNSHELSFTNDRVELKQLPQSINLTAEEDDVTKAWTVGSNTSIVNDPLAGGNGKAYQIGKDGAAVSNFLIPVNPNLNYTLSGRFRSASSTCNSNYLLGFVPVRQINNWIDRMEYYADGELATVASVSDDKITVQSGNLATWNQPESGGAYLRSLGFYFDGQTNHLPDYVMYGANGAYSTAVGNTINLNLAVPEAVKSKIVPGITKVRNNHGGSTYLYTGASYTLAPQTSYSLSSGSITGINTSLTGRDDQFPYNTQWVKIIILGSLGQTEDCKINFDDISVTVSSGQSLYSWQSPYIKNHSVQPFDGRVLGFSETLASGNQGQVRYQVSIDGGVTWLYYNTANNKWESGASPIPIQTTQINSGAWYIRDYGPLKANTAAEINTYAPLLTSSGGNFTWRAFLESNGSQAVRLSSVSADLEIFTPKITNITPSLGQTMGGDEVVVMGGDFVGPATIKQMSSSAYHSCAISSDNQLYCWGQNNHGQLGDGTTTNRNVPTKILNGQIPSGAVLKQVAVGYNHSCVLTVNGVVYCWGKGDFGQLGNRSNNNSLTPVAIDFHRQFIQISLGSDHSCALADNDWVYCWGSNIYAELGTGNNNNQNRPIGIAQGALPNNVNIKILSAGGWHNCVIATDDKLYCWGYNYSLQVGNGGTYPGTNQNTPVAVVAGQIPSGVKPIKIAAGYNHSCITATDSKVYCWGDNRSGQIGNGNTSTHIGAPSLVAQGAVPAGVKLVDVKPGQHWDNFTCAVASDGRSYCWGQNDAGQLGSGNTNSVNVPSLALTGQINHKRLASVSSGAKFACAVDFDGKAYCWGANDAGQLGSSSFSPSSAPVSLARGAMTEGVSAKVDGATVPTEFVSKHQLKITMPAHALGQVDITVINPNNEADTLNQAYTYENIKSPTITSVTPNSGLIYGGNEVEIKGSDFNHARWKLLASGRAAHSCAIGLDNNLYCWGSNDRGQLGNGANTNSNIPVAVSTSGVLAGKTIKQISVGSNNTCAISSDDKAYCWGYNINGQLGNGANTNSNIPVAVSTSGALNGKTIKQISVGIQHTCAIASDNQAYCWGYNINGQLGNGANTNSNIPVAVSTSGALNGKTIKQISAGGSHTCVIASDNQAYCWGSNGNGQLGNGTNTSSNIAVAVSITGVLAGKTIKQISTGGHNTCVLASDNQVYCWGSNINGQLGNGTKTNSNVPVAVSTSGALNGKTIKQISAGNYHTCVIASDNQAYCWGSNGNGQLGNGTNTSSNVPVAVSTTGVLASKTIKQIENGDDHTCAISSDNRIYCWGVNNKGQLGNGTSGNASVQAIAVQDSNYLVKFAATSTAQITSFDNNRIKVIAPAHSVDVKQLSLFNTILSQPSNALPYTYTKPAAPTVSQVSPGQGAAAGSTNVAITGHHLSNLKIADNFVKITAGGHHTCAIASNDQAYCWGNNNIGQLGNGTKTNSNIPVAVSTSGALNGKTIKQISAGGLYTCAIASDNQVYCWGNNFVGQLGNGVNTFFSTPVAVSTTGVLAGKTIKQISAGDDHTCAIASDDQAYCWGNNGYGQLGNGANTSSNVPVAVSTTGVLAGKTIKQISVDSDHTCAIASNDQAYCWGYNGRGQLGNGINASSNVPVAVSTTGVLAGKTIKQIETSDDYTCAIASDNQAYCWGYNGYGQLGNGANTNSNIPVAVSTTGVLAGKTIKQISTGGHNTCVLTSDNQAYCWGSNNNGQLGNGTNTSSNVPVIVSTTGVLADKTIKQISAGVQDTHHICVINSDNQAYCWGNNGQGQLGNNSDITRYTPSYVMMKENPKINFGGSAYLANILSNINLPSNQYSISTTITVKNPAHPVGAVAVQVINPDGQSSSAAIAADNSNKFTYVDVPSAPTNLVTAPGPNQVILNWNAPSDNGSVITDYIIQYCASDALGNCSGPWLVYNDGENSNTSATVSGLNGSETTYYSFRVKAKNAVGVGPHSAIATEQASYITVTVSTALLDLSITPDTNGKISSKSMNVATSTNNPNGYDLYIHTLNSNLNHAGRAINPGAGTPNSPLKLQANQWGYRVDGLANFGPGLTSVENNQTLSSSNTVWARVPTAQTTDKLNYSTNAINNHGTKVWFAASANTSLPAATYQGTVVYTGVAR